jgi:hypothetical protein
MTDFSIKGKGVTVKKIADIVTEVKMQHNLVNGNNNEEEGQGKTE